MAKSEDHTPIFNKVRVLTTIVTKNMMGLPCFWEKWTEKGTEMKMIISRDCFSCCFKFVKNDPDKSIERTKKKLKGNKGLKP